MVKGEFPRKAVPKVRFPAPDFEEKGGLMDYSGTKGVTRAFGLTARGIISMVPPAGFGGAIDMRRWADGIHLEILEKPESVLRAAPAEDPPPEDGGDVRG